MELTLELPNVPEVAFRPLHAAMASHPPGSPAVEAALAILQVAGDQGVSAMLDVLTGRKLEAP